MSIITTSWNPEAQALGFENEKEMLYDLYMLNNFSLSQIAKMLGYSYFSVRRRLLIWGINLRHRGGPNNNGNRRLRFLSDEELAAQPKEIALSHGVHIATVFAERRLREKMAHQKEVA
jgi:hypothetical protein